MNVCEKRPPYIDTDTQKRWSDMKRDLIPAKYTAISVTTYLPLLFEDRDVSEDLDCIPDSSPANFRPLASSS